MFLWEILSHTQPHILGLFVVLCFVSACLSVCLQLSVCSLTKQTNAVAGTDEVELDKEMAWASSRPCSTWSETDTPKSSEGDAFLKTLTETEFGFYGKYVSRFPGGIYSLNQNPDVTCIQSVGQATWLNVSETEILLMLTVHSVLTSLLCFILSLLRTDKGNIHMINTADIWLCRTDMFTLQQGYADSDQQL